ncbi:MAG: FkbM family methyltransferase [Terracidiphilus sp.]
MLRTVAERLSRGRSFSYRLPEIYGSCRFYITPEAGLRYWIPSRGIRADETLLRNASETVKPGSVVWDVGANMGLFSFAAAGLAGAQGRVYAFEPDAVMARLLRRSARLNPQAAPVEVISCAIAEDLGLAHFEIAQRSRASNALEGFQLSQGGGVRDVETVVTASLDWLAERLPAPDVLKIDVEGAELAVFRGAQQMLKSKRPILLFELTRLNWPEESRLLADLGYTLFDSEVPRDKRQPLTAPAYNILGIPAA